MSEHNSELLRVVRVEDNVTHTKYMCFVKETGGKAQHCHCWVLCQGTADVHRLCSRQHHQFHAGRSSYKYSSVVFTHILLCVCFSV